MDFRDRLVPAAQVAPEPKCRVRRELLVLNRLRQRRRERARDALHGVDLEALRATRRDQIATIPPTQRAHRPVPEQWHDVASHVVRVKRDRARLEVSGEALEPGRREDLDGFGCVARGEFQVAGGQAGAELLRDAVRGLPAVELLRSTALLMVVDEDPPVAAIELHLDRHGSSALSEVREHRRHDRIDVGWRRDPELSRPPVELRAADEHLTTDSITGQRMRRMREIPAQRSNAQAGIVGECGPQAWGLCSVQER